MKRLALGVAFLGVLVAFTPVAAHELPRDEVASAAFIQHLGRSLPLDAEFFDEDGNPVRLGHYFGNKPVILSLNYFHCQFVCPIEEDSLIGALNSVSFTLGNDFTLLTVSIDPHDGPLDATSVKARAIRGYDRPQGADGWHLLTGDDHSIQQLTDAVGFRYTADPLQGDFAHPIGVLVLTPDGDISQYLNGMDFHAADVQGALAGTSAVGQALQVICYQYDPLIGRFTPLALNLVRGGGALGLLLLLAWLGWMWRTDLQRSAV